MSIHRQRRGRPWRSFKADLGPAHFMATVWGAPSAWAFSIVLGRRFLGIQHHYRSLLVHRA